MPININRKKIKIPIFKPLMRTEEYRACKKVLDIGWLGMGSFVGEFEERLQEFLKLDSNHFIVAVNTGTSALHLALLLAGVGPGDEVITPSFNNIADFQAIIATGAKLVFCDINDNDLCIDINKAEVLVSKKTKAIIVMDYGCILCKHDEINKLAKKYNLRVIHDASHSFGSKYKGKMVGSFSDITIFSFDPVKTITCIDGGALVVRGKKQKDILHEMRLIGMGQKSLVMYKNQRSWTYNVKRIGFRYHMANLHAAIGLAQMQKIKRIISTRREVCREYNEAFKNIKGIRFPLTDFKYMSPFLYYLRVNKNIRNDLRGHLKNYGIDTGIHWTPGHNFTLLKNFKKGDLSVTNKVASEIFDIPLHSFMKKEHTQRVINSIKLFFK